MPTTTEFAPGTPCWVDLSTSDLDAARGFYGTVLGWNDFEVAPAEAGYYTMALVDGQRVAGMMTASDDERAMAVPPHWNTYVCTTSADDSAERARELGGAVVAGPFDVLDVGRMAVVLDREGAAISVWEPRAHPGFGLLRQPGAFTWVQLGSRDPEQAKAFYTELFGWKPEVHTEPMPYTEWKVNGTPVAGMLEITPDMGPMPVSWQVFFEVSDPDGAVDQAKQAGGAVYVEPMDVPAGRFGTLGDPQGAVFSVMKSGPLMTQG